MSADDHLSEPQFMPVSDLLKMHSHEAMRIHQRKMMAQPPGPPGAPQNGPYEHGDHTRLSTLYERKARDIADEPELYHQLDEPIKHGDIDPVMIQPHHASGGEEIYEGAHRVVRAHQLGVQQIPVTRGGIDTQKHYDTWEN